MNGNVLWITSVSVDASEDNPSQSDGPGYAIQWAVGHFDDRIDYGSVGFIHVREQAIHDGQTSTDGQQPTHNHHGLQQIDKLFAQFHWLLEHTGPSRDTGKWGSRT